MKDMHHPIEAWRQALASRDPDALLRLNGYHLAKYPRLAPVFADLKMALAVCDLGTMARAQFVAEVLEALLTRDQHAAVSHCRRLVAQLEDDYTARHRETALYIYAHARDACDVQSACGSNPADPVSDDEAAWWREAHKWGC